MQLDLGLFVLFFFPWGKWELTTPLSSSWFVVVVVELLWNELGVDAALCTPVPGQPSSRGTLQSLFMQVARANL